MKWLEHEGEYELSSGRRFHAASGEIGIGPDADGLTYGADGSINVGDRYGSDEPPWTAAERQEIAEHMIQRWKDWLARGSAASDERDPADGRTQRWFTLHGSPIDTLSQFDREARTLAGRLLDQLRERGFVRFVPVPSHGPPVVGREVYIDTVRVIAQYDAQYSGYRVRADVFADK